MIGRTIVELSAGDHAELTRVVDASAIASFVDAVGDYNPVHSDPEYAARTPFREPIAPGISTAGLISAVIGTRLPGPGAIYLSQSLKFLKPVMFGDRITARAEVVEVLPERNRIRIKTLCVNQHGDDVLTGEAWVMPSKTSVVYEERRREATADPTVACSPWLWPARAMAFWGSLGLAMLGHAPRRG
jgi:3-hydroxybutyryl-CoA dehydratase